MHPFTAVNRKIESLPPASQRGDSTPWPTERSDLLPDEYDEVSRLLITTGVALDDVDGYIADLLGIIDHAFDDYFLHLMEQGN